jgi:hypothetical protein
MAFRKFFAPVLLVRIALALAALALALAGFAVSRRASKSEITSGKATYACPMHPEVISATPADCPICRMALEPVKRRPLPKSGAVATGGEPHEHVSFSVPADPEFRAFDAISRTKIYPLSLEMRAPASVESDGTGTALFSLDASELVEPDEAGYFSPETRRAPDDERGIEVRVSHDPPVKWDRRTARVRFVAAPGALVPGEVGSVKLATRIRRGLVVREGAIVESADGPHVFVVSDDRRTVTRRAVEIGNVIFGYAAIVSGLRENENVAARYTFLLDVERRALAEVTR